MSIYKRTIEGNSVTDPSMIDAINYNEPSGSFKNLNIGPKLVPLFNGTTYVTTVTSAFCLPAMGKSLAIYNKGGTVRSINFGESGSITSLAIGITDGTGHVGIPCAINSWTYLSAGSSQWVIADHADLVVFLIEDPSYIRQEASR
jgi:hypothetical protein